MNAKVILIFFAIMVVSTGFTHASIRIQDSSGNNITQISRSTLNNATVNINYTICSIGENTTQIKLLHFGVWNMVFSNSIIMNLTSGACQQILTDITLLLNASSGNYTERIIALSLSDVQQLDVNIDILESTVWYIDPVNITVLSHRGDLGKLMDVSISNSGNVDVTLVLNLINSNNMVWFDTSPVHLLSFSQLHRPVYYYINNTLTPDIYTVNISASDNSGNTKISEIFFNVTDDQPPVIDGISLAKTSLNMGEAALFSVSAHDDKIVSYVYARINGIDYNMTHKNQTSWEMAYNNTNIPGIVNYMIVVSDGFNTVKQNETFEILKKQAVFIQKDVVFGKVKVMSTRVMKVGEIQQHTNYAMRLRYLTVSNPNVTVQIIANEKILQPNTTYYFQDPMVIFFKVQELPYENSTIDDMYVFYNGVIDTEAPEDTDNPAPQINFRGVFGQYDVTPADNIDVPVMSNGDVIKKMMFCNPQDSGVYENSSYDCQISYPVDIGSENLPIITSVMAYKNLKEGYEKNLSYINMEKENAENWRNGLLIGIIIVVGSFIFWYWILRWWHHH